MATPDNSGAPSADLPPLQEHTEGRISVFLDPDAPREDGLEDLLRLPEILEAIAGRSSRLAGTPTCWQWHPDWLRDPGLHVRLYAHGGALGRVLGTTFLGPARMMDEFRVSIHARRRGVPVPVPVALRVERKYGPLVTAHYLCELVPQAVNLLEFCAAAGGPPPLRPKRRADVAAAVADAVARMHEAGIVHADLNLKNILVRPDLRPPEALIVDFDKATLADPVLLPQRMENLLRLDRSVLKWAASRALAPPRVRIAFLRTYLTRYPEWAARWKSIAREHATEHALHTLSRERS